MLKLSIGLYAFRTLSGLSLVATVLAGHQSARVAFATLMVLVLISASRLSIRLTQERTINTLAMHAFPRETIPDCLYRGNDR